jgi:hypothetical protein
MRGPLDEKKREKKKKNVIIHSLIQQLSKSKQVAEILGLRAVS